MPAFEYWKGEITKLEAQIAKINEQIKELKDKLVLTQNEIDQLNLLLDQL